MAVTICANPEGSWSYYDSDAVSNKTIASVTNNGSTTQRVTKVQLYLGKGNQGTARAGDVVYSNGSSYNVSITINGCTSNTITVSNGCPLTGNTPYWNYTTGWTTISGQSYPVSPKYVELKEFVFSASNRPTLTAGQTCNVTVNCYTSGTALIRFPRTYGTDGNRYYFVTAEDDYVPVTGVSVSPGKLYLSTYANNPLGVPLSGTITATVTPSNATNKSITWRSDNTSHATVNSSGTVYAVDAGACTVYATSVADTSKKASTTVYIYINPYVYDVAVRVNNTPVTIINGDTTSKITYSTRGGMGTWDVFTHSSDVSTTGGVSIYTITSSAGTEIPFTPSAGSLFPTYDNTDIRVRVTERHSYTGVTNTGYTTIKVRYKPVEKPINVSSPLGRARSNQNYTISWQKPSGYNGIYSKYTVTMTDETSGDVVTIGDTPTTSITFKPGDFDFIPSHKYTLTIQPKYVRNGTDYFNVSAAYVESNFMEYVCIPQTQVDIISPTGNGLWYGGKYKILIQMPLDDNYEYLPEPRKTNYRYEDLIITVNNEQFSILTSPDKFSVQQQDLTHQCWVIMDYDGTPLTGTNTITAVAKFGDGIEAWSILQTRNYQTEQSYPIMSFVQDEYILSSNFVRLCTIINNMVAFVIPSEDDLYTQISTSSRVDTLIYATNYVTLLQALHKIYEFIARYGMIASEITLTQEYIDSYEDLMDDMNDTIGSGDSEITDPDSVTQSIVYQLNQVTSLLGMGNPLSLLTNYYEVTVVNAADWVGVIIYALGLAAYVYEMILRVLGITEDNLLRLMYAIENKCDITYIGSDSTLYTISAYGIVNNIIKLLGVGSYYNPDGTTQSELITVLRSLEATAGISRSPEPTTTFTNTLREDVETTVSEIEITTRS